MPKSPKARFEPQTQKTAKAVTPTGFNDRNPSWRVGRMEMVDPFGWHVLDGTLIRHIQAKLADFERMTWNDIFVRAKKQHHAVSVESICSEAKKRLRELKLDDRDEIHRLRLTGKQRIWGIYKEGVLTLLWWDPEHLICPSEPR